MKTSLMNGKFILRTKNMKGKNEMKNSKYARIIILVLSLALLIGAAKEVPTNAPVSETGFSNSNNPVFLFKVNAALLPFIAGFVFGI